MYQKISIIPQLLRLPAVCVLCSQYHRNSVAICRACRFLFERIENGCAVCALPLPDKKFSLCGQCIRKKPFFDKTFTAYQFEEPLRSLIHDFKYRAALYLTTFLGQLMLEALPMNRSFLGCLVPVPLHTHRMRQRGFNQAAQLVKLLAKWLKMPYELALCEKIIPTERQINLSAKQRRKNLYQAFKARPTSYEHITLVDDLLTTGSTANELARILKQQGVARVHIWCCARATR